MGSCSQPCGHYHAMPAVNCTCIFNSSQGVRKLISCVIHSSSAGLLLACSATIQSVIAIERPVMYRERAAGGFNRHVS
jgi:hypothetical protein